MLAEVAAAHKKGRRLIIGTTQLDAQRLVLWDMGAIAASGDPEAIKLFRKIMLTSASIPGAFPPQYIKVEADGKFFEEMHVDGGTTAEVVLYETALKPMTQLAGTDEALTWAAALPLYYPQLPDQTGMGKRQTPGSPHRWPGDWHPDQNPGRWGPLPPVFLCQAG